MLPANTIRKSVKWLNDNFRPSIENTFKGTPFEVKHIYGIAWVESSELWPNLIDKYTSSQILGFCVLDGSGDVQGTSRRAFPKNKAAFEAVFGPQFTQELMDEGNKARKARGMPQTQTILYKAYGIFQYDLQFVQKENSQPSDRSFFETKLWYSFDECLKRLKMELMGNYNISKDVRKAIRSYNGSGSAADAYVNEVFEFIHEMEQLKLP
jgi:hypothetical protein